MLMELIIFMMISLIMVRHDLHDYIRTRAN